MNKRAWPAADLRLLRKLYPNTRTRDIQIPGKTRGQIKSMAKNLHLKKSTRFMASPDARKVWTPAEKDLLTKLYPDRPTKEICEKLKRNPSAVFGMAAKLGLEKSELFRRNERLSGRFNKLTTSGVPFRFQKGHAPANKGLRRPGWAPGRMAETQFKKGGFPVNRDPDFYVIGALRINTDGYIDMRISFDKGSLGWRGLHLILWEDAHGPIQKSHCLRFKDGDKLNVGLDNLVLITRADNCRRNSIHNLPAPLRDTIQLLGQLKRRINEKQDRGSQGSPVRDAGGSAG